MKRRAIIIGGSISGLFSAAFLRQIGWDVDVYPYFTFYLPKRQQVLGTGLSQSGNQHQSGRRHISSGQRPLRPGTGPKLHFRWQLRDFAGWMCAAAPCTMTGVSTGSRLQDHDHAE
jgi:hypothetical protein